MKNEELFDMPRMMGASLVGMGLAWLYTGARAAQVVANTSGATIRSGIDVATAFAGEAKETAKEQTAQTFGAAADKAQDLAEAAQGLSSDEALASIVAQARKAQDYVVVSFERQPLLLGVAGLALGAAIAAMIPQSNVQR